MDTTTDRLAATYPCTGSRAKRSKEYRVYDETTKTTKRGSLSSTRFYLARVPADSDHPLIMVDAGYFTGAQAKQAARVLSGVLD